MKYAALISIVVAACLTLGARARARSLGDGASLFKAKCAVCHGPNGDASTEIGRNMKLRDLRSPEVQKRTDAQLMTIVCCGTGRMLGYETRLTSDQIAQLVGYLRTLAGKKPQ